MMQSLTSHKIFTTHGTTGYRCSGTTHVPLQLYSSVKLQRSRVSRSTIGQEGELVSDVDAGTRIKVVKEVTVYHAPKTKELQLQGREGTVKSIVKKFKGKELSANLPYKIEFMLELEGGKQQKLLVHLDASEFEAVS